MLNLNKFQKYLVKSRKRQIVWPRQVIFYYLYNDRKMKYRQIEQATGFHRATVMHSVEVVADRIRQNDKEFFEIIQPVRFLLKADQLKKPGLKDNIRIELQKMGIDSSDDFAICGSFGHHTFTVGGFIDFVERVIKK
jgi:hypothetical protein